MPQQPSFWIPHARRSSPPSAHEAAAASWLLEERANIRRELAAAARHREAALVENARARTTEVRAAFEEQRSGFERETAAAERAAAASDQQAARRRHAAGKRASLAADRRELYLRSDPHLAPHLPPSPKAPLRSPLKASLDAQARWGGPRAAAVTAAEHERLAIRERLRQSSERQFMQLEVAAAEAARAASAAEARRAQAESDASQAHAEALALRQRYSRALDENVRAHEAWGGGHVNCLPEDVDTMNGTELERARTPTADEVTSLRKSLISSGFSPWTPSRRRRHQEQQERQAQRQREPTLEVGWWDATAAAAAAAAAAPATPRRERDAPASLVARSYSMPSSPSSVATPRHHPISAVCWESEAMSEAGYRRLAKELRQGHKYGLSPAPRASGTFVAWEPHRTTREPHDLEPYEHTKTADEGEEAFPDGGGGGASPPASPSTLTLSSHQILTLAERKVAKAMSELATVRASIGSAVSPARSPSTKPMVRV